MATTPNDSDIEIHHLGLQTNQERNQDLVFTTVGHISAVDPTTNKIKVIFPDRTNDNQVYMESNWIPLGTPVAGNQFGIQFLPYGGATINDVSGTQQQSTTVAEQVIVTVIGRKRALYIASVQMFNKVDVPPSGYQDKSGVAAQSGEWLAKHASGQYLYVSNQNVLKLISLTNPAPILIQEDAPSTCTQNLIISASAIGSNTNSNGDNTPSATATVEIIADSSGADATTTSNLLLSAINPDAENSAENTTNVALNSNVTKGSVGQANLDLIASSKGADEDNAEFTLEASTESIGTAQGTINIDAATLGTGTLDINVRGLTATLNINVDGETNEMNVTVLEGIINVTTDIANVNCLEANVDAATATTLTTGTLDATCSGTATIAAPLVNVESAAVTLGDGVAQAVLNHVTAIHLNGHTHSGVMPGSGTTGPMDQPITFAEECHNVFGS